MKKARKRALAWFNADVSRNKSVPIRESVRFTIQAEFLTVFNHPTFSLGGVGIQSTAFGQQTAGPTTARRIELRANLEF